MGIMPLVIGLITAAFATTLKIIFININNQDALVSQDQSFLRTHLTTCARAVFCITSNTIKTNNRPRTMASQVIACIGCEHVAVIRGPRFISDILPGIERTSRNATFLTTDNHAVCHEDKLYFTFCYSCERQRALDYNISMGMSNSNATGSTVSARLTNINIARSFLDHWPLLQNFQEISISGRISSGDTLPRPVLKIEFLSGIIRTHGLEVRDVIRWEGDQVRADDQSARPFFTVPE